MHACGDSTRQAGPGTHVYGACVRVLEGQVELGWRNMHTISHTFTCVMTHLLMHVCIVTVYIDWDELAARARWPRFT